MTDREWERIQVDRSRIRQYVVSLMDLIQVFNGRVRFCGIDLPEDATVVHIHNDHAVHGLVIGIHSMSFAPVLPGATYPRSDRPALELVRDDRGVPLDGREAVSLRERPGQL